MMEQLYNSVARTSSNVNAVEKKVVAISEPVERSKQRKETKEAERTQINQLEDGRRLNLTWIAQETEKDEFLKGLREYIQEGWPNDIPKKYRHWFRLIDKLTTEKRVVLFEDRVWIPEALKAITLKSLHVEHVGMVKMKATSRK